MPLSTTSQPWEVVSDYEASAKRLGKNGVTGLFLPGSHFCPPRFCSSRNLGSRSSGHLSAPANYATNSHGFRNAENTRQVPFELFDSFLDCSSLLKLSDCYVSK